MRMTKDHADALLQFVRSGLMPSVAVKAMGLSLQAVAMRKKRDPSFRSAWEDAVAAGEEAALAAFQDAAVSLRESAKPRVVRLRSVYVMGHGLDSIAFYVDEQTGKEGAFTFPQHLTATIEALRASGDAFVIRTHPSQVR